MTRRWFGRGAAGALMLLCAVGCQSTPRARMQADVKAFQAEQTRDKLIERGRGFAAVGDTTRAQQYFDAAISAGADERVVTPLLLQVCVQDGRYRLAVEYAGRYVKRHPGDVKMRFILGTLYAALGETELAAGELEHAARSDARNPHVQYALAVLLRDQRSDLVAADRHFREYLRLAPTGEHAEEARASTLQEVP